MRKFKWVTAVAVTLMAGVLVACNGIIDKLEKATEVVREPSTRTPNSVIGKWYQYEEWDLYNVYIWEFEEGGKYYFTREENYYKQDEDYIISKYDYSVNEDEIHIPASVEAIGDLAFSYEEANTDGKIYVQAGSYAEEFFKAAHFTGEVIVE